MGLPCDIYIKSRKVVVLQQFFGFHQPNRGQDASPTPLLDRLLFIELKCANELAVPVIVMDDQFITHFSGAAADG